jgi:apolipoprotein D and lipocalin family protein
MTILKSTLPYFLSVFMAGCSSAYNYTKTVPNMNLQSFMGKWYVQAGRFTMFEKETHNSVEEYTWLPDEEKIKIEFHYNQGSLDGKIKSIPQTGWIVDKVNNTHWKISPLWPLKFDYLIIGLGELDPLKKQYEWTVIGVPDQKWIWVMTRDPHFPREKTDLIIKEIKEKGYNVENIVYVPHNK